MILIGNIPFRYLTVILLLGAFFLPYIYFFKMEDYQKQRITVQYKMLMGQKVDTQNEAYNAHNNLMAIGKRWLDRQRIQKPGNDQQQGIHYTGHRDR